MKVFLWLYLKLKLYSMYRCWFSNIIILRDTREMCTSHARPTFTLGHTTQPQKYGSEKIFETSHSYTTNEYLPNLSRTRRSNPLPSSPTVLVPATFTATRGEFNVRVCTWF
ncbi:hypothetical protein PUN28_008032 [Cardiocondyla obscurior]|uniref:Secreted protein n=1 Tax=Cardiocondyla obscurior TaxID=286306 RepID=A0AAW2G110_9HYME